MMTKKEKEKIEKDNNDNKKKREKSLRNVQTPNERSLSNNNSSQGLPMVQNTQSSGKLLTIKQTLQHQKSFVGNLEALQAKLVFDFGLILEQNLTYYSGLICAVTVKSQGKIKKNQLNQEVTMAYGGRFDNNIANF